MRDHGSATEPPEPLLDITDTATDNVSEDTLDLNYKKTIGENIKRLEKFKPRIRKNLAGSRPFFPYDISGATMETQLPLFVAKIALV